MTSDLFSASLPVRFLSAGRGSVPGNRNLPDPEKNEILLIIRNAGSESCPAAPAEAFFIPFGHPLPAGLGSGPSDCLFWLCFRSADKPDAARVEFSLLPMRLSEVAFNRLSYGFCQLVRESKNLPGSSDLCDYMLSTILLSLRDSSVPEFRTAAAARMLEYIHLHCYERLTMPDVARALGYSEDYLSRLLHEQVSCSFRRYIHYLRIQRAKQELLSGSRTIREIAEDCGYSNPKFFSTAFQKCEGITPSVYRNLYVSASPREGM